MFQVNSPNTTKSVFIPLQSSGHSYAITKPFTETQKQELEKEKEQKTNHRGYNIAKIGIVTGFGVLIAAKGAPRKLRGLISKFSKKIDKTDKNSSEGLIHNLKPLVKYTKTLFNFAPLKDVLFKKLSKKVNILKKTGSRITEIFENVSVKTAKKNYKKTSYKFDNLYGIFLETNDKLKLPKRDAEVIEECIKNMQQHFNNDFGINARRKRLIQAKADMGDIDEKVWERTYHAPKNYITNKKNYQSFISEELAAKAKIKLLNDVFSKKELITSAPRDKYSYAKRLLHNIETVFYPSDKQSAKLMAEFESNVANYKITRNTENKNLIIKNLKDLEKQIKDKELSDLVKQGKELFSKNNENKGEIQKILKIYEKHLSKEDYQKIEKQTQKALKSLNHSVDAETDRLFDKVRDLQIGSAPVDVLSVLSSFGVVAWGLSKAENKEERTSVALKYGIPAVGAVSISLFCTLALVSGGPALAIGLVSGLVMNKLGVEIDNYRKKHNENPQKLINPSKILTDVAKNLNPLTQNKSSLQPTNKANN